MKGRLNHVIETVFWPSWSYYLLCYIKICKQCNTNYTEEKQFLGIQNPIVLALRWHSHLYVIFPHVTEEEGNM